MWNLSHLLHSSTHTCLINPVLYSIHCVLVCLASMASQLVNMLLWHSSLSPRMSCTQYNHLGQAHSPTSGLDQHGMVLNRPIRQNTHSFVCTMGTAARVHLGHICTHMNMSLTPSPMRDDSGPTKQLHICSTYCSPRHVAALKALPGGHTDAQVQQDEHYGRSHVCRSVVGQAVFADTRLAGRRRCRVSESVDALMLCSSIAYV